MGSFSVVCVVSRLTIEPGDLAVLVAVRSKGYASDGTIGLNHDVWRHNKLELGPKPYVFGRPGVYDDYGRWRSLDGAETFDPIENKEVEYHFFVRQAVWDSIQQCVKNAPVESPDTEGPSASVSAFDEELSNFLHYCYIAGVQVKPAGILGCQYMEPLTVRYSEHLNRITRLELRKMLLERQAEDADLDLSDAWQSLQVPLCIDQMEGIEEKA